MKAKYLIAVLFSCLLVAGASLQARAQGAQLKQLQADKSEANKLEFSKRPLKDFGAEVNRRIEENKLDLFQPFEVKVEGELDADGRLQNATYRSISGDKELCKLAAEFIAAVNDSGTLYQLRTLLNQKKEENAPIAFNIQRTGREFLVKIEADTQSGEKAKSSANSLNALISLAANARKGREEAKLLENTKAVSAANKLFINFAAKNEIIDSLIQRQLDLSRQ